MFKKAIKHEAKLRMAIDGPSGSGKTYTSLVIASAMAQATGARIAVIDTERGSASKYSDIFDFDVCELGADPGDDKPFSPENYIKLINGAAGYGVLVIDSLSHAWSGKGGLLEFVDETAKKKNSGNKFAAWGEGTPLQNRLMDTILKFPGHMIITMRTKTEYVLETNSNGKQVPRKIGTAPIQRDGVEYEFDVVGDMDYEHNFIISKSRCSALADKLINKPDGKIAQTLLTWLSGTPAPARPAAPVILCADCSTDITTALASNGTTLIHVATSKHFKRPLCRPCAEKAAAAEDAAKQAPPLALVPPPPPKQPDITCTHCSTGITAAVAEKWFGVFHIALCDACGNAAKQRAAQTAVDPIPPVPTPAPATVPDNGKSMASLKW